MRTGESVNPIEIKELRKYYGDVKAVDGITFTVNTGEVFALLGPNGAGKTTTIEILEGLRKKDSGEVQVLGLDPWEDGPDVHLRIGVIPQEFNFFEKTSPREAIHLYARLFDVEVDADEILREVLLEDKADTLFDSLSGGQKQKTGLALSLVNSPDLLFLDEPTTGLDPNARRAIWEVIRGLKAKGRTIVLTTHYLDEAQQLSDRVAIMDHGKIVAQGTSDEIIRQHGSGERLEINGSEALADIARSPAIVAAAVATANTLIETRDVSRRRERRSLDAELPNPIMGIPPCCGRTLQRGWTSRPSGGAPRCLPGCRLRRPTRRPGGAER